MITNENVDQIFAYHPPIGDQQVRYDAIRSSARSLAHVILDNTKIRPDQQVALRKLRECVMTANAAIALEGVEQ